MWEDCEIIYGQVHKGDAIDNRYFTVLKALAKTMH